MALAFVPSPNMEPDPKGSIDGFAIEPSKNQNTREMQIR